MPTGIPMPIGAVIFAPNDPDKFLRGDGQWAELPGSCPAASESVATELAFSQPASAGSAESYARGDHTHGTPAAPTKDSVGLGNVPNINATDPANISQDSTHRFVSDAEKAAWNKGPRTVYSDAQATEVSGPGTYTLKSYNVPAGLLANNGDWLEVEGMVRMQAAVDYELLIAFIYDSLESIGISTTDTIGDIEQGIWFRVTIYRIDANTQRVVMNFFGNTGNNNSAGILGDETKCFQAGQSKLTNSTNGAGVIGIRGIISPGDNDSIIAADMLTITYHPAP